MNHDSEGTSAEAHRAAAAERGPVRVAVITVSDSRTPETDPNGRYLREQLSAAGHEAGEYRLVPDDPEGIEGVIREMTADHRLVILNGGTGIARRDNTYDVVARLLEKEMAGFGEIFRMLSYEQVGAAAMLSRATAGVLGDAVVFSLPGSPAAVRLAWEKLIEPELAHLAWEVGR